MMLHYLNSYKKASSFNEFEYWVDVPLKGRYLTVTSLVIRLLHLVYLDLENITWTCVNCTLKGNNKVVTAYLWLIWKYVIGLFWTHEKKICKLCKCTIPFICRFIVHVTLTVLILKNKRNTKHTFRFSPKTFEPNSQDRYKYEETNYNTNDGANRDSISFVFASVKYLYP